MPLFMPGGVGQLLLLGQRQSRLSAGDGAHLLKASSVAGAEASGAANESFTLHVHISAPGSGAGMAARATASAFLVGELLSPRPRAGCGKSARPVRLAGGE